VFVKLENLQLTGSYKIRGALNKITKLTPEIRSRGVVTASAGNHAQGVAYAAALFGIAAESEVWMAQGASDVKRDKTRAYGVRVETRGASFDEASDLVTQYALDTQKTMVHAFDDWDVIAGQGTVALEMLDAEPELSLIVAPVGGGGLVSGIAVAVSERSRPVRVLGVEPEGAACMRHALKNGSVQPLPIPADTIADGVKVNRAGNRTFEVCSRLVGLDNLTLVTDGDIALTMNALADDEHVIAEAAGATGLAAILRHRVALNVSRSDRVGVVVTGGNIRLRTFQDYRHLLSE
jgi:threonine dehydratase